jgi:hypothetical protein
MITRKVSDLKPSVKKKVKAMIEGSMASFIDILKRGIANGELSDQLNPEEYCLKVLVEIFRDQTINELFGLND